jgi:hypothetical protein
MDSIDLVQGTFESCDKDNRLEAAKTSHERKSSILEQHRIHTVDSSWEIMVTIDCIPPSSEPAIRKRECGSKKATVTESYRDEASSSALFQKHVAERWQQQHASHSSSHPLQPRGTS